MSLGNPGLRVIVVLAFHRTYAYRAFSLLNVVQIVLQLVLLRAIWTAVYGDRETLEGVDRETTVVYLTVIALMNFMLYPGIAREIYRRVDQGQVATDFVRPVGFVRQMLALELGDAAGRWSLLVLVIPLLLLAGSLAPPDGSVVLVFLLSAVLGYAVSVTMWLIVGLSSFWLLDIEGVQAMVGIFGAFLAGVTIPLWFMPGPLRAVVELLPFQAMHFLPASIWVETGTGAEPWRAIGVQVFWLLALGTVATLMWGRARRRLVVQGG